MTSGTITPQRTDSTLTTNHGDFTVQIDYGTTPKLGLWQNQVVNVLALGNQEGNSPALLLRNAEGQFAIAALDQVQELTLNQINTMMTGGTGGLGNATSRR